MIDTFCPKVDIFGTAETTDFIMGNYTAFLTLPVGSTVCHYTLTEEDTEAITFTETIPINGYVKTMTRNREN